MPSRARREIKRIFCIEDNALIVMHLEMLIEEAGFVFAGGVASFADLKEREINFDLALVDIDLADGRTGGEAAAWLHARGLPCIFVTGQDEVAQRYRDVAVGLIAKPIATKAFRQTLERFLHQSIG